MTRAVAMSVGSQTRNARTFPRLNIAPPSRDACFNETGAIRAPNQKELPMTMTRTAACMLATAIALTSVSAHAQQQPKQCPKEFVVKWKRWVWGKTDRDPATMPMPKQPCTMGTYVCDQTGCGRK